MGRMITANRASFVIFIENERRRRGGRVYRLGDRHGCAHACDFGVSERARDEWARVGVRDAAVWTKLFEPRERAAL